MGKPDTGAKKSTKPVPLVSVHSRSSAYHRKGKWAKKSDWKPVPKASTGATPKVKKFGKKNEDRTILPKGPKYYPTERVRKLIPNTRANNRPAKLRSRLVPGAVLILLSGKYRSKKVVLLKALPSGLLVVAGPFALNGVPLRRVNPAYVIATTTRVDLTGFTAADKFDDAYFKKPEKKKQKKTEAEFFAQQKKTKELKPERVADQKAVDDELLKAISKVPLLKQYLNSSFTLRNGQFPHALKF